jgi:uncharacterized membrane protein YdfJ with MMPL/SSD domain
MLRFFIFVTTAIAGLLSAVYIGGQQHWLNTTPSFATEIILFLGISTIVIFYFLIKHTRSRSFTQAYLVSMVLKMLAYAAFILVIIFSDKAGAGANAVLFLVAYLLFTGLEVGFLFPAVNR